jgi:hypothetical protein
MHRGARALKRRDRRRREGGREHVACTLTAAPVPLRLARRLTRAPGVLVRLVVTLVCVDLCVGLAGSVGGLLADIAGVF